MNKSFLHVFFPSEYSAKGKKTCKAFLMASVAALALISFIFIRHCSGALQVGFYKGKCQSADVENVVFQVVRSRFNKDLTIIAALLRMQFHDCFVTGCDASILLDGSNTEKTSFTNAAIRGYEIIDAAKAAVGAICPDVVSCADIIAFAARDAVSLSGGGRYNMQTGRRDGTVSLAQNVNLPASTDSIFSAISQFARKGLNSTDLVLLLGGHTVGTANCFFIQSRLYKFQNTAKPDQTLDSTLLNTLRKSCPQNAAATAPVNLDQNRTSSLTVDDSYYKQLILNRGILQIDQELALDPLTKAAVSAIAIGTLDFSSKFAEAMVKLGAVQVLTGNQGQIRKSCRTVNKN